MGLKEIKDVDRIVFLKMFTEEMLFNFINDYCSKKAIEEEKIKRKIFEPVHGRGFVSIPFDEEFEKEIIPEKKSIKPGYQKKNFFKKEPDRKIPVHLTNSSKSSLPKMFKPAPVSINSQELIHGMDKIHKLLRDNAIQSIECPGPGKYLIIKKRNQINVTKIVLSQDEILRVIEYFSRQARIPTVGGILTAAIGNLFISAISSQIIGSRFIITRKTPYSLISHNTL